MDENVTSEILPRKKYGITPAQSLTLKYLEQYIEEKGYPPTFQEIADNLGMKSKSRIRDLLMGLEERGRIDILPNRARSIMLCK